MAEVKYLKSKSKNNYVVEEKSDTRTRSDNSDTTIFELKNTRFPYIYQDSSTSGVPFKVDSSVNTDESINDRTYYQDERKVKY